MIRCLIFCAGLLLSAWSVAEEQNSVVLNKGDTAPVASTNSVVMRKASDAPSAASAAPADASYLIQPGDVLQISVWKEPELQQQVLVRPDGAISLPLAGDVQTKNKSVEQLRAELKSRLEKLIPDIDVTVSIVQLTGNKVYVIGQVNRPGEYTMTRPTDVMQALSMAAGTTKFADLGDIRILRRSEGDIQEVHRFNYNDVQRGRNLGQNMVLRGGDVIVVP